MKLLRVLFLGITFCMMTELQASDEACLPYWHDLKTVSAPEERLDSWINMSNVACLVSDFYYLKLGWLFIEVGNFNKAHIAFLSGEKLTGAYQVDIKLGLIDLIFQRATRGGSLDLMLVDKAKNEMATFIQTHPGRSDAYALMSGIQLVLEEYQMSIQYADQALKFGDIPFAFRNMAISYAQLGKAEKTVEFAGKAIGASPSLEGDRDLMLAASMGYYELGNIELAYGTIRLLIDANPGLIQDPLVKKIGYALQQKFDLIK